MEYRLPGSFTGRTEGAEEALESALEEARWQLGPVRVEPSIGIRQSAWVDNVFAGSGGTQEVSDFTATVGAGLQAWLPVGADSFLAGYAAPEYVWWLDLDERRRLNQGYGLALFGFYNRARLELTAERAETQQLSTPEFEQFVNGRTDTLRAEIDLRLTSALGIFFTASDEEFQSLEEDDARLPELDRLERSIRLLVSGLFWEPRRGLRLGLGVTEVEVEFPGALFERSYSGSGPLVEIEADGSRVYLHTRLARPELEPEPGSAFPGFDEVVGEAALVFGGERRQLELYGDRQLFPAISIDYESIERSRGGVGLRLKPGERVALRLFYERGRHDFEASPAAVAVPPRQDDLDVQGIALDVQLSRRFSIRFGAQRLDIDSTAPDADRTTTALIVGLGLGGLTDTGRGFF